MKTISIHAATPFRDDPLKPITIDITQPLPPATSTSLDDNKKLLWSDAQALMDALSGALPQGTLDRLYALLAQRHVSDLHRSYEAMNDRQPAGITQGEQLAISTVGVLRQRVKQLEEQLSKFQQM